jgi:ribosomal protein S19E (S16A)
MPHNDAAFCTWVLRQLYDTDRNHMVEPFYIVRNGRADMRTVYQTLENGGFANAAEFERGLSSVPAGCLVGGPTRVHYTRAQQEKVGDLSLALLDRFKQRNRWESTRRRSQQQHQPQQQAPTVPSTSASAAASHVAPSTSASAAASHVAPTATALPAIAASALAQSTAAHASPQPRFSTPLVHRPSATPGPSRGPTVPPRKRVTKYSGQVNLDNTSRQVSEAVEHDAALAQACREKKRAASSDGVGTGSKRPRREIDKYKYRYAVLNIVGTRLRILTKSSDLRIEIAGVIDREMDLIHEQRSSIELAEGTQHYVGQLSQMDAHAMQKAKKADLNEFKEDHVEQLESLLVGYVRDEINNFLATKGRSMQPRVSLSIESEHEREHGDEDEEEIADSETDSRAKVKKE